MLGATLEEQLDACRDAVAEVCAERDAERQRAEAAEMRAQELEHALSRLVDTGGNLKHSPAFRMAFIEARAFLAAPPEAERVAAAEAIARAYFEIAEEALGEDEVRRRFLARLPAAAPPEIEHCATCSWRLSPSLPLGGHHENCGLEEAPDWMSAPAPPEASKLPAVIYKERHRTDGTVEIAWYAAGATRATREGAEGDLRLLAPPAAQDEPEYLRPDR